MVQEARVDDDDIFGVGIAMPGPVGIRTGRPGRPPALPGWEGVDIPSTIGRRFPVPVVVDRDGNAEALGEYWSAWRHEVDDLLYVKCGTGMGCGIILDGRIHRGAESAAGEIGHVRVHAAGERPCFCGQTGCLATIASGRVLTEAMQALDKPVRDTCDVVGLAVDGDPEAVAAVYTAGTAVGEALVGAVNLLNPSVLVVGGDLAGADVLLTGVRDAFDNRTLGLASRSLRITGTSQSERSGIIGAAITILDDVLAPTAIDRLLDAA